MNYEATCSAASATGTDHNRPEAATDPSGNGAMRTLRPT
jgi:hypothetical protein